MTGVEELQHDPITTTEAKIFTVRSYGIYCPLPYLYRQLQFVWWLHETHLYYIFREMSIKAVRQNRHQNVLEYCATLIGIIFQHFCTDCKCHVHGWNTKKKMDPGGCPVTLVKNFQLTLLIFPEVGGGRLWVRWGNFGFHKTRGISWLAANQLASQEGLCSME
jgi:hypothetical protein